MRYWRKIASHAWRETIETTHLNSIVGFIGWLIATIVVIAGLSFFGSSDASRDEVLTRLFAGLAFVGVVIPLVFAWKFVGVPARMDRNLRSWLKELEAAILEARETDKAIFDLADRYNAGVRLLSENATLEQLHAWEVDFDKYVRDNFEAGFYMQVCGPESPQVYFTTVRQGDFVETHRHRQEPLNEEMRIDAKVKKVREWISLASSSYRGRTINTIDMMCFRIREFGLHAHQSPQDTGQKMHP